MDYLYLAGGFLLLLGGGNLLVQGAVTLARRLGVSPLLTGLVVVGIGTSLPELVASLTAALQGSPGIALGNVMGSNIANVLLILGLGALLHPIVTEPRALRRDGAMLAGATVALAAVLLAGWVGRPAGGAFLAVLAAYLVFSYRMERGSRAPSAELHRAEATFRDHSAWPLPLALLSTLAGMAGILLGAELLISGALSVARQFGVSESVIGLTVVALGTSLPELVTTIVASRRRQGDVALGNVIGSNIFNVLGILGVTALVAPIPVPAELARLDLWVVCGATLLLLVFAATGRRIGRREGAALLACYLAYLGWLAFGGGLPGGL